MYGCTYVMRQYELFDSCKAMMVFYPEDFVESG